MKFSYFAKTNPEGTKLIEYPIDWVILSDILGINVSPELVAAVPAPYVIVREPDEKPIYDTDFEQLEEGEVTLVNGFWMRNFNVVRKTLSQIDGVIQTARRTVEERINHDRLTANSSHFIYKDKRIACNRVSKDDLFGTNSQITNRGKMPDDWIGMWKTMDNSYLPIPDVATWNDMYECMYLQGMENFKHSAYLKTLIEKAKTIQEIRAIHWDQPSPFKPIKLTDIDYTKADKFE